MLVKELLNEASRPGRAWNNKIKKIDSLLAWMYDKDILTATDKKEKDKVFYQYYRYYNDGDLPGFLRIKGVGKHDTKQIEEELEKYLEAFIKKMLAKYLPKVDRTEFRYDKLIDDLTSVSSAAYSKDAHALLTYWLKTVKIKDDRGKLGNWVEMLDEIYNKLKNKANTVQPESKNTVMSYRRKDMKKSGLWTKDMERDWVEVEDLCDQIGGFINNIILGINKLKKLRELEKQ